MVLKGINWVHYKSLCTQLTPFNAIWTGFSIVYPIDSFQHHLTKFYHCVPYWLLSRPFDQILSLCTELNPFKTIWPNFIIVYPIDSFEDHIDSFQHHLTRFYHCVQNWLLSRPFDPILSLCTNWILSRPFELIFALCTQLTPFKTIWQNFIIVYPNDSFQDHMN